MFEFDFGVDDPFVAELVAEVDDQSESIVNIVRGALMTEAHLAVTADREPFFCSVDLARCGSHSVVGVVVPVVWNGDRRQGVAEFVSDG